jgi:hypothetical protein
MTASDHEVYLDWTSSWNESCALVVEVFGLPGNRFISSLSDDFMTLIFKNKKDADLCRILLSDKL